MSQLLYIKKSISNAILDHKFSKKKNSFYGTEVITKLLVSQLTTRVIAETL